MRVGAQLLHRNLQRFRGGLVSKAHGLCVSLNSRLEKNDEDEEEGWRTQTRGLLAVRTARVGRFQVGSADMLALDRTAFLVSTRTKRGAFWVQDSGFRVQGSGFRIQGSGCRAQGSGFRVSDFLHAHPAASQLLKPHAPYFAQVTALEAT